MQEHYLPFGFSHGFRFLMLPVVFGLLITLLYPQANKSAPPGTAAQPIIKNRCSSQDKVNINTASLTELQTLPGIGPSIARRIVDFRAKNPPFQRIEDLLIIKGINRKLLEKIRPFVII
jgi:comEA protein